MSSAASAIDPDVLATLTDDERAALVDTPSQAEIDSLTALAAGADDEEDDDDGADDDGDADAAPAAAPAPAPAAAPAAAPAPAAASPAAAPAPEPVPANDEADQATPFVPQYVAVLPDDFQARKDALSTRKAEAWKGFEDGTLDRAALQTKLAEVENDAAALDRIQTKVELSQEMSQQTAQQTWQNTINSFMATTAKNEGIDYRKDADRAADLDMFIKSLAYNPAHENKPPQWFLNEAHRRVKALHGDAAAAPAPSPSPAPAPVDPKVAIAAAKEKRKPDADAVPKTLATVPGTGGQGDVGSEFADMDSMSGEELEAAIARMSPAQREKFAALQ